mmetsp:Transcript_13053/g.26639  ORF Transcript_13053/g.26639 Transcript_13053/m.26639 type:complete len:357 (-) Transcript_13053:139-1209(-)
MASNLWSCDTCTYTNSNVLALACEMCGSGRTSGTSDHRAQHLGGTSTSALLSSSCSVTIVDESSDDEADIVFSRGKLLASEFSRKLEEKGFECLVCGHRGSTQLLMEVHLFRQHGQESTEILAKQLSLRLGAAPLCADLSSRARKSTARASFKTGGANQPSRLRDKNSCSPSGDNANSRKSRGKGIRREQVQDHDKSMTDEEFARKLQATEDGAEEGSDEREDDGDDDDDSGCDSSPSSDGVHLFEDGPLSMSLLDRTGYGGGQDTRNESAGKEGSFDCLGTLLSLGAFPDADSGAPGLSRLLPAVDVSYFTAAVAATAGEEGGSALALFDDVFLPIEGLGPFDAVDACGSGVTIW